MPVILIGVAITLIIDSTNLRCERLQQHQWQTEKMENRICMVHDYLHSSESFYCEPSVR